MLKAIPGLIPMYVTATIVVANIHKRSFIYNGRDVWNNLPGEIGIATHLTDFKWRYKYLLNTLYENERCPFYASWLVMVFIVCVILCRCILFGLIACVPFQLFFVLLYHAPAYIYETV